MKLGIFFNEKIPLAQSHYLPRHQEERTDRNAQETNNQNWSASSMIAQAFNSPVHREWRVGRPPLPLAWTEE